MLCNINSSGSLVLSEDPNMRRTIIRETYKIIEDFPELFDEAKGEMLADRLIAIDQKVDWFPRAKRSLYHSCISCVKVAKSRTALTLFLMKYTR